MAINNYKYLNVSWARFVKNGDRYIIEDIAAPEEETSFVYCYISISDPLEVYEELADFTQQYNALTPTDTPNPYRRGFFLIFFDGTREHYYFIQKTKPYHPTTAYPLITSTRSRSSFALVPVSIYDAAYAAQTKDIIAKTEEVVIAPNPTGIQFPKQLFLGAYPISNFRLANFTANVQANIIIYKTAGTSSTASQNYYPSEIDFSNNIIKFYLHNFERLPENDRYVYAQTPAENRVFYSYGSLPKGDLSPSPTTGAALQVAMQKKQSFYLTATRIADTDIFVGDLPLSAESILYDYPLENRSIIQNSDGTYKRINAPFRHPLTDTRKIYTPFVINLGSIYVDRPSYTDYNKLLTTLQGYRILYRTRAGTGSEFLSLYNFPETGAITPTLIQTTNRLFIASFGINILLSDGRIISISLYSALSQNIIPPNADDRYRVLVQVTDTEIINVAAANIVTILNATGQKQDVTLQTALNVSATNITSNRGGFGGGARIYHGARQGSSAIDQPLPDGYRLYQAPSGTTIVGINQCDEILILPK